MKTFTVKDFLMLNSPCFGCGGDIDIRIGVTNTELDLDVYLKPSYALQHLTIPLVIKYNSSLKLIIDCKTNKFAASDLALLTAYLKSNKLFLSCRCSLCLTTFVSEHLEFNLRRQYIKPVGVLREFIIVQDRKNKYEFYSIASRESTMLTVFSMKDGYMSKTFHLDLPIIHRHRFKDKEHLMNKIRTYLVFS